MAEFHTLGSPPILEALLAALCASGARLAQPGEFTLRAFLTGRIDLTQAEAVLGVVDAADPGQLQVATAQLAGGLAGPLHKLRDALLELLAHLEAGFDFADEDLPFITSQELQLRLDDAAETAAQLAVQIESRAAVETTVRAVLFGQPNTGKSSLFNALARKHQALVSDTPGTTRDYLLADLDFDGRKCQLIDTAGFRPTGDCPDFRGHRRGTAAKQWSAVVGENGTVPFRRTTLSAPDLTAQATAAEQLARADVRLLCLDVTRPMDAWEQAELARDDSSRIVVCTKADALADANVAHLLRRLHLDQRPAVVTSSVTGQGLDLLRAELRQMTLAAETAPGDVVPCTAARCQESIHRAGESLENARRLARE